MSSLTWINSIISQASLHNNFCSTDMRPFHWYAKIRVTASPSTRAYKYIVLAFCHKLMVHAFHLIGYLRICVLLIILRLDIDNIMDIAHNSISKRVIAT